VNRPVKSLAELTRNLMNTAFHEVGLSSSSTHAEKDVESTSGLDVEEKEEHRNIFGFRAQERAADLYDQRTDGPSPNGPLGPFGDGETVELFGASPCPGLVERNLRGETLEQELKPRQLESREQGNGVLDGVSPDAGRASVDQHVPTAFDGLRVELCADVVHELRDSVLRRPQPHSTEVDGQSSDLARSGATAESVARLEDGHRRPGGLKVVGGGEPRETRAYDDAGDVLSLNC